MNKTSVGPLKRDDDSNELIIDKKMCEILEDQYVSSYNVKREELELAKVENQIDEDSPTLKDIKFKEMTWKLP